MENGYDRKFAEKFSGLAISGAGDRGANNDSSLFQVMKAVEAAEATIKQQVKENIRLRTELQNKILELDRYLLYSLFSLTDPNMQAEIQKILYQGHSSFKIYQSVGIPYGSPSEFVLTDSAGGHHLLKTDNDRSDYSCSRDTVVATLRMFILSAGERKKRKKRGLIF